jgi:16S rRNA (guanine527-N7)-methyltransferase
MQDHLQRIQDLLAPYPFVPTDAAEKILSHLQLVLKWGKSMNLTGATKVKELIEEHAADAMPLAALLAPNATLLDVGAGAGFPGVIVTIMRPDVIVTMVESNHKKGVFLRTALREAGCKGVAVDGDVFQPPKEWLQGFDAVVSRAVFAPEKWVEVGAPFVKPGGSLYALLAGVQAPAPPPTFPAVATHEYRLVSGAKRSIAAYRAA